eukprot:GHVP01023956.1.p1 GENE.GHVP01023956.1~~GHVP01023956.1.p1  ORF type:complete len:202 (+),score=-6.41 GHVP01023956.1:140-745(+)
MQEIFILHKSPSYLLTDCSTLSFINKATSGRLLRWSLSLQQFDISIHHFDGTLNCFADTLSRSTSMIHSEKQNLDTISFALSVKDLSLPTELSCKASPTELRDTYIGSDQARYHIHTHKLYIPPPLRYSISYWFHFSRFGGHHGIIRTIRRVTRYCWWPHLPRDIRKLISYPPSLFPTSLHSPSFTPWHSLQASLIPTHFT